MSKTYTYRHSILIFKYIMIFLFFLLLILTIINFQNRESVSYLFLALSVIALPIIYFLAQLSDTKITLTNEAIYLDCHKKHYHIKLSDITHIDVKSSDKFNGYIYIHSNIEHPIYITIRLDELDDFLRTLYKYLLAIEHPEIHNEKLFSFYKIAIEVKCQHERLKKIIKYYVFYILLNLFYIFVLYQQQSTGLVINLFLGYLGISFITYIFIELIFYSPKMHTISLNQFNKIADKTNTSDLLFVTWVILTIIHLILVYILTIV